MKVKYLYDNEIYEIYGTVYEEQHEYGEIKTVLCFVIWRMCGFQTININMFVPVENNESEEKVIWR